MTQLARTFNLTKAGAIEGWMSEPELLVLANFAYQSKMICEAGCYRGRSTRAIVDNTLGKVYAVDPWDGKYQIYGSKDYSDEAFVSFHSNGNDEIYSQFYMNLYRPIQQGQVIVNRMNFTEFFPPKNVYFDFIFIDAIHEYQALKDDIAHALPLMEKGGILAGHDYIPAWPGVIQAVDELFPNAKKAESIWYIEI